MMPTESKSGENRRRYLLLVLLFFCSGTAGLGYQIVWAKLFAAGIGHEFPSVLAVVTAFMGGMAAGAWVIHLAGLRSQISARLYGWLELIIAFWGAATVFLIPFANGIVIRTLGIDPSPAWQWFVVFTSVFLALFPATAAMGATLPAIERFTAKLVPHSTVGLLYAANTGGALVGALLSVFALMPKLGIPATLYLFASFNAVCGIAALWLGRRTSRGENASPKPEKPQNRSRTDRSNPAVVIALLATGLLGIGYETTVVRALSHVLENTVYTFAVVLGIHLLGTGAGAALYHRNARLNKGDDSKYFLFLALGALIGGMTIWMSQPFYDHLRAALPESLISVALAEMIVAASVFLLPSMAMGGTFSYLAEKTLARSPNLGLSVCLNTLGAAVGPLVFGLVAIPNAGLKFALGIIPLGYALLVPRSKIRMIAVILVAATWILLPGTRVLIEHSKTSTIRVLKEGIMASVAVVEEPNGDRVLKVNNRFQMGGTAARIAEERHADLPLLLHPNPERILFLGLGTGITFSTAAYYPHLIADGVELVPEVAQSMNYFQNSPDALSDPRLRVHVSDARRFILTTTNTYHVIVGDLFHPAQDGAGFLYSKEHFLAIKQRLNSVGIFCQWLPLFQMDLETFRIITRTFLEIFPNGEAWMLRFNVDTPVIGLIGREGALDTLAVERSLTNADLHEHLKRVALSDNVRLLGCFVAGPENLRAFSSGAEVNTDLWPVILFRAPLFAVRKSDDPAARLNELIERLGDPSPALSKLAADAAFFSRTEKFIQARNVYLKGLGDETRGRNEEAIAAYVESARLSPDFTSGYAQCITLATALAKISPKEARDILQKLNDAQPERSLARELLKRLQLTP